MTIFSTQTNILILSCPIFLTTANLKTPPHPPPRSLLHFSYSVVLIRKLILKSLCLSPFLKPSLQTCLCPHAGQFKSLYNMAALITHHTHHPAFLLPPSFLTVFNFPLPPFLFIFPMTCPIFFVSRAACPPCVNAASNNQSLCVCPRVCAYVCVSCVQIAVRWVSGLLHYLCKTGTCRPSSSIKSPHLSVQDVQKENCTGIQRGLPIQFTVIK